jgi:hypothetical protein
MEQGERSQMVPRETKPLASQIAVVDTLTDVVTTQLPLRTPEVSH